MQGTILIIDGVSTNRILLKVLLSAAWYHVVQAERLAGLRPLLRRVRPDLVVTTMDLPDGSATRLRQEPLLDGVPILAIAPQNDRAARLAALRAGLDDVQTQPLDDSLLQARIRALLRNRAADAELSDPAGLAEAGAPFAARQRVAHVALVAADAATGAAWRDRLSPIVPHQIAACAVESGAGRTSGGLPDAFVIGLTQDSGARALDMLADLRAHATSRRAVVIAVTDPDAGALAAEALNRGADDVLTQGFDAVELALRLDIQLRRKERLDQSRNRLQESLRDSMRDALTGLYNRRHALPFLAATAGTGQRFAVMLADLDRFKQINDRLGHLAGDAVLAEAARRIDSCTARSGMVARIGGEEFMIVLPGAGPDAATAAADQIRRAINAVPVRVDGGPSIAVTVSIGALAVPPGPTDRADPKTLIAHADRALYAAKAGGRDRVTLVRAAA